MGIRLHQDTDKRRTFGGGDAFPSTPAYRPSLTAYKKGRGHSNEKTIPLTVNQTGQFKGLKPQTFFSSVRELSEGVLEDEREQGSLSEGNEESLPCEGG